MINAIRAIAWAAIAVGVSAANSEAIIVPVVVVVLGAVLLKLSEIIDGEVQK